MDRFAKFEVFCLQSWIPAQIVTWEMMEPGGSQYSSGLWQGGRGSSSQHFSAELHVYEIRKYAERSLLGVED